MNNLPCEVIEDLLPSYTEGLTSSVTNAIVDGHLKTCERCSYKYQLMKNPVVETSDRETKEIDFLKKTKKHSRKWIFIWASVILLAAIIFIGTKYYFMGNYMNTDYLAYNLDVSGSDLTVAVSAGSDQGIQKVKIFEDQGVVEITVRGVARSIFYDSSETVDFRASQEIRQVWIGDRIIWANGEMISPITSNLYAAYNPYIGNMPMNGKIVNVLNMTAYTGPFINELQTSEEPYSWKMIFENNFSANRRDALETRLKNCAYIFLAEIGNLSEVIYEYKVDGETMILSVTCEEASAFAGSDIKAVIEDINLLEKLVRKTGLSNVVMGGDAVESNAQVDFSYSENTERVLGFTIINYAEDEVYGLGLSVECENETGFQGMTSADGSALQEGLNVQFQLIPEDFEKTIEDGLPAKVRLTVTDKDGNIHKVQGAADIDLIWGTQYRLNLSGDAKTGYYLGK